MRYLPLIFVSGCLLGCQGLRALDSTAAVAALTAGEQHVTYSTVPVPEGIDPSLAGKLLLIPTVPGKDVDFKMYNDAGQLKVSLTTTRSAVIDMLLGSIAGIDVEKFAEDARVRQWVSQEREAWMALVGPMLQARASQTPQPTGELKQLLLEVLREKVQP